MCCVSKVIVEHQRCRDEWRIWTYPVQNLNRFGALERRLGIVELLSSTVFSPRCYVGFAWATDS